MFTCPSIHPPLYTQLNAGPENPARPILKAGQDKGLLLSSAARPGTHPDQAREMTAREFYTPGSGDEARKKKGLKALEIQGLILREASALKEGESS